MTTPTQPTTARMAVPQQQPADKGAALIEHAKIASIAHIDQPETARDESLFPHVDLAETLISKTDEPVKPIHSACITDQPSSTTASDHRTSPPKRSRIPSPASRRHPSPASKLKSATQAETTPSSDTTANVSQGDVPAAHGTSEVARLTVDANLPPSSSESVIPDRERKVSEDNSATEGSQVIRAPKRRLPPVTPTAGSPRQRQTSLPSTSDIVGPIQLAGELEDPVATLSLKNKHLHEEITQLKGKMSSLQSTIAQSHSDSGHNKDLQQENEELKRQISALNRDLARAQTASADHVNSHGMILMT